MKEGEIKFSNAFRNPLFEKHRQIWEQNPDVCPEVETALEKELVKKCL